MDGRQPEEHQHTGHPNAPEHEPVVELRHEAGLTAGHTLTLRPGVFRLGPRRSDEGGLVVGAPEAVSFDLTVGDDGDVTLTTGIEPVAIEGVVIDRSAQLDDRDVIQLQTDHFVLRSPHGPSQRRAPSTITPRTVPAPALPTMSGLLWLCGLVALFGLGAGFIRAPFFGFALIGVGGIVATLVLRMRRHEQARQRHSTQLSNARSLLFREIIECRKDAAETLRIGAPTPAAVAQLATTSARETGAGLKVTIAAGDRSWAPPVVCHRETGWDHDAVIEELSFLPAIPYTIDLDDGPVAIVGPRAATLAVARHITATALVSTPPNTGVAVATSIPSDWRWLTPSPVIGLRVLDGVDGDLGPRTVIMAADQESLPPVGEGDAALTHLIVIDESGQASVTSAGGRSEGFVPHGITMQQAARVHDAVHGSNTTIDLRDRPIPQALIRPSEGVLDTDGLLVTGPDQSRTKDVLATTALRQAVRHPDRSIVILDRGDRALIRLAQLDACHRYVAIDQISHVELMLDELDAIARRPEGRRLLVLAPDLWETVAFYRNSGRSDLATRIDALVQQMHSVPLAASTSDHHSVPASTFLVWVNTERNDVAEVRVTIDGRVESQLLDLSSLPGTDLTGSVARLTIPFNEESSR